MGVFRKNSISRIAIAAFLLQGLIPLGYMPANLADGQLVRLCPDGMPVEVMVALLGDEHAHHAHHHKAEESSFEQCDLGGGPAGLVAALDLDIDLSPLANGWISRQLRSFVPTFEASNYRSRAPPTL